MVPLKLLEKSLSCLFLSSDCQQHLHIPCLITVSFCVLPLLTQGLLLVCSGSTSLSGKDTRRIGLRGHLHSTWLHLSLPEIPAMAFFPEPGLCWGCRGTHRLWKGNTVWFILSEQWNCSQGMLLCWETPGHRVGRMWRSPGQAQSGHRGLIQGRQQTPRERMRWNHRHTSPSHIYGLKMEEAATRQRILVD